MYTPIYVYICICIYFIYTYLANSLIGSFALSLSCMCVRSIFLAQLCMDLRVRSRVSCVTCLFEMM